MTIDEAIKHYEELAEVNEDIADNCDMDNWMNKAGCEERASDYRQLADWLRELQELREKHWDECRQIAHYDNELREND